jgi:2-iminobutanoate/2-iminopropanoate deaminase
MKKRKKKIRVVHTEDAPAAIGPYSQAVVVGRWVFASGQVAIDPATGEVVEGGIGPQTERVLQNLNAVLETSGASLSSVVKTTVFLTSMGDFTEMNEIYGRHFGEHRPARATVEVSRLPKDVAVEIECVARRIPA